jgi:hypothetical protein
MALAALILLLYAPSLSGGFILDDLRNLRLFREYRSGLRESLDLYCFLPGGPANRALQKDDWCPWWAQEELRYRHFRPLAERILYWEYLVFGDQAFGYRAVGILLYMVGVRIVLALFRLVSDDERVSRWAGLIFAVAACHTIPVVFIAAHCDLIALVLVVGAMVLVGQFIRGGGPWRLGLALFLYGGGLLAKEAALPAAILPFCFWIVFRGVPGVGRRTVVSITCLMSAGLAWLGLYLAGGYGSNAVMMLDPIHMPWSYLTALPGRTVLLLSTWLVSVNPFLFHFHHDWDGWLLPYGVVGGVSLALVAVMYWRRHRSDRSVAAMAVWVLPFMPLLVCTVPDDRVMMLPSVGFALLGAAWLTRSDRNVKTSRRQDTRDGSARLRRLPLTLFVFIQAVIVLVTSATMQFMEWEARRHLKIMVAAFERESKPGDHIFLLNTARNFEALMTKDRLRRVRGTDEVGISLLSDISGPKVTVLDERTLRLEAQDPPLFSSFIGMLGTCRDVARREGDVVETGGFQGRITKVEGGAVVAVELRFEQPISSDSYRFFWNDSNKPPVLWAGSGIGD